MARKKEKAAAKEVERKVLSNGTILVKYDDGSYAFITPIPAEDAEELFNGGSDEDSDDEDEEEDEDQDDEDEDQDEDDDDDEDESEDDEDEDSDDDDEDSDPDEDQDEDEDEEVTPEQLAEADFEGLEDICDDKELETDPDEYDEKDVEKLRAAIAKELGIKLPKAAAKSKKDTKKKKK